MRYDYEDLIAIKEGRATMDEVADKYGVKKATLLKALNRNYIYLHKKLIIIHTPYGAKKCYGIMEVARELNLSKSSIKNALRGKRVKTIEDLDIKLEVIDYGKKEK